MSKKIKIDQWSVFCGGLFGYITGHPNPLVGVNDNMSLTSRISTYKDGKVITVSGTAYTLGNPFNKDDAACKFVIKKAKQSRGESCP